MYKVIILEDEPEHARRLQTLLRTYARSHVDVSFNVTHYDSALRMLEAYRNDADLLLLDIQVPDMSGIELARELRGRDADAVIVFITALPQYAIDGYAVGAFDYIVKPFSEGKFFMKLDRICRKLSSDRSQLCMEVRTQDGIWRLPSKDILYIETNGRNLLIHTSSQAYSCAGSLKGCEAVLKEAHFVRCSSGVLVNLRYVSGLSGNVITVGETPLTLAHGRRASFLGMMARYKGGSD